VSKTVYHLHQKLVEFNHIKKRDSVDPKYPLELNIFFDQYEEQAHESDLASSRSPFLTPTPAISGTTATGGKKRRSGEASIGEPEPKPIPKVAWTEPASYRPTFKPCAFPILSTISLELSEVIHCKISNSKVPSLETTYLKPDTGFLKIGANWKEDLAAKKGLFEGGSWCRSGYFKDCFRVSSIF